MRSKSHTRSRRLGRNKDSSTEPSSSELYAVGKVVGCFGIKGFLKVQPSTHSLDRFSALETVHLGNSPDEECARFKVEEVIIRDRFLLLKLESVSDRNAAEQIVGKNIFVDGENLSQPASGEYFVHDVIGCEVVSSEGKRLGIVSDVLKLPAQDVWVIRNGTKEHLIPAVKEFVERVDTKQRRIVVSVIEGLIEE